MADEVTPFGAEPFTAGEAARAGLSDAALRRFLTRGTVRRVLRGVFVEGGLPDSLELRARAVAKVVPPGSVVCGRTAAWLWGVDALAMGSHRTVPPVDVMAPAGRSHARRAGVFGCTGPLAEDDVLPVGGVWVASPMRTAADLARLLPRPDALASLDAMLRVPGTTPERISAVLDRFGGYRGVVQARELVLLATPLAESPQESRTRLRCIDAGFPPPHPQLIVTDATGRFVARLDMGWLDLLRAVEFDGDEHHSASADVRHDRERRDLVERCGWGLAVVTTAQVLSRGLEFERAVSELLALPFRLTRHHPHLGGWDGRSRWAAA